jgi:hypothetical protein
MLKGRKLITPTYYSTHNPFDLFNFKFDRSSYIEKMYKYNQISVIIE